MEEEKGKGEEVEEKHLSGRREREISHLMHHAESRRRRVWTHPS